MRPIVLGCNHKTAPLELREKLAFDPDASRVVTDRLRAAFPSIEAVILCTCNRSEFYLARPTHGHPRRDELITFFSELASIPQEELAEHTYYFDGRAAIEHLFRVASSLDSMVVGETQILSQIKQAVSRATEYGSCGKTLTTLFQWSLHVAKEVHTETQISSGQVSVGSVAVQFAQQIYTRLSDKTLLMIGAGEMGKLTLRHFVAVGPRRVIVANRTPARAQRVAPAFGAEAVGLDRLMECLTAADLVITCTGSGAPILSASTMEQVQARRKYRPIVIIDIAIPRDVDPLVQSLDNVYLYNIDDLQSVADNTLGDRQARIALCNGIVNEHVGEFIRRRDARSVGPLIQSLRKRLVDITTAEGDWAKPKLTGNPHHDRDVVDQLLHRIVGKILHEPTRNLSERVAEGHVSAYAEMLRTLFQLPAEEEETEEKS